MFVVGFALNLFDQLPAVNTWHEQVQNHDLRFEKWQSHEGIESRGQGAAIDAFVCLEAGVLQEVSGDDIIIDHQDLEAIAHQAIEGGQLLLLGLVVLNYLEDGQCGFFRQWF